MRLPGRTYLGSRLGRRVLVLFVLSALVPLLLAGAMLASDFNRQLQDDARRELARSAESYGMVLIGRLNSAAETLEALSTDARLDDYRALIAARRLAWAQDATVVQADAAHESARAIRLRVEDIPGSGHSIRLECPLSDGAGLRVTLRPDWLFSGIEDYAGAGSLSVHDADGRALAAAGDRAAAVRSADRDRWQTQRWEMFLRGGFGASAWQVETASSRPTLRAALAGHQALFPGILAASLALVALLSAVAIRRQLRPLEQLRLATEQFARRDFSVAIDTSGRDEFGDLARTLASMSNSLRLQFSALEALAEVDRMLLHAPDLERILDALLPRMAAILGCGELSALLLDADLPQHGRVYDYSRAQPGDRPVRRVCEISTWQRNCGPTRTVHALRRRDQLLGYLAVPGATLSGTETGTLTAGDFADRLSLILSNVEHSRQLHRQARYDSLTGLPNRRTAGEALALAIEAAQSGGRPGAVLYIDLDRFKRVNDTAGHRAGDALLCQVAERLQGSLLPGELAARLAGDEFLLVAPAGADVATLARRAGDLLELLNRPIRVDERVLQIEASIGIAVFPRDGARVDDLLRCADIAMYRAKESGRGRTLFFEPRMQEQLQARLDLEAGLRRAFEREDFRLAYQPIVPVEGRGPLGAESLLRWPVSDGGTVWPPSEFVPVAEDMGLIVPLGDWVLRTACREFMGWKRAGECIDYLSVNVSPLQLRQVGFAASVFAILSDSGMRPQDLMLEVTETVFADGAIVEVALRELEAGGVRLALDDFGTGYSSLSYLGKYPFHAVKIDRSFVMGLPADGNNCRLVESIIAMCAALGKRVVAEGVETPAQRAFLADSGCHALQGYLLARPVEAGDLPALLPSLRNADPLLLASA